MRRRTNLRILLNVNRHPPLPGSRESDLKARAPAESAIGIPIQRTPAIMQGSWSGFLGRAKAMETFSKDRCSDASIVSILIAIVHWHLKA